ncbi:MAG: hypothetical protein JWO51_1597 [Rhodospirillales bacterium]|nr:hypothetical protein [Rhodospirillales bacterium]
MVVAFTAMGGTQALAAGDGQSSAPKTFSVSVKGWVPGFGRGELEPFIAKEMDQAAVAGWHFIPAPADAAAAPDRVEWRFKPNRYAGGLTYRRTGIVRRIDRIFGKHRLVSVEARLYRNGEYELRESAQPTIQGGPRDADLQKQIMDMTRSLESASNPGVEPNSDPLPASNVADLVMPSH